MELKTIRIDCARMTGREAAHDHLSEALGLPSCYGRNLDALADCLWELPSCRIVLENVPALEALGEYGAALLEVFRSARDEGAIPSLTEEASACF